ncbi:MAG: L-threonylcarbamoyladenylate synthase [Candidatus Thermoplasmatota archaeon]
MKRSSPFSKKNEKIRKSILAVNQGKLIVYPTDTLYALGADIYNISAVKKVFQIKKRPFSNPLPIAIDSIKTIKEICILDDRKKKILEKALPGGITFVLKKKKKINDVVTAGLNKIAIRIPDNKNCLKLLSKTGPLTATSANIHGEKTHGSIEKIKKQLDDKNNEIAEYIQSGTLENKPSTIVDITTDKPKIVRQGKIKIEDIDGLISNG